MSDARSNDRLSSILRAYQNVSPLRLLTDSVDRRLPYSREYAYAGRGDLYATWGFAYIGVDQYTIPPELEGHLQGMYDKFPSEFAGRDDHLAACPRVCGFKVTAADNPRWEIGFATYRDQIATNMYADEPFQLQDGRPMTVRGWDQISADTPNQLPSFEASRLANTIGVAIGATAHTEAGDPVILWRRRSDKVRVYQLQPHVTLSFALNVPSPKHRHGLHTLSMRELIFADYNAERAEELGVEDHQFYPLKPVAFCRDLLRAGKPQLFLEQRSRVPYEQLKATVTNTSPEWIGDLEAMPLYGEPPPDASPELLAFIALSR